ncbi:MAG TPA: hypothetical protein VFQ71_15340 [Gaiellales bacterium]|nr:hypothetical protein [Gaiellales bacterium]
MAAIDFLGLSFPLFGVVTVGLLYRWFLRLPDGQGPDDGPGRGRPVRPAEPCGWRAGGPSRRRRRRPARRRSRAPFRR